MKQKPTLEIRKRPGKATIHRLPEGGTAHIAPVTGFLIIEEQGAIYGVSTNDETRKIIGGAGEFFPSAQLPKGTISWFNGSGSINGMSINPVATVMLDHPIYGPLVLGQSGFNAKPLNATQMKILLGKARAADEKCKDLYVEGGMARLDQECRRIWQQYQDKIEAELSDLASTSYECSEGSNR